MGTTASCFSPKCRNSPGSSGIRRIRTRMRNPTLRSFRSGSREPEEEEDKTEHIDDGVFVMNNKDNYFAKEDFEKILKKFPDYERWNTHSQLSSSGRVRPRQKIKWKQGDVIGNGSFGKVVTGLDVKTGVVMAVKQVQLISTNNHTQQERIASLEIEIDLLSQLSHKNIVRYYGSEKNKNTFNIFLEYVSGGTIASLIAKYGPLNENLMRIYTKQILEGLEYLHMRNIIHRDIKGGNVLVENNGSCKLVDFGTAKRISTITGPSTTVKVLPSIRGTVNWMAPEIMQQETLTRFSDIWSVGCTVIEMATGKAPWSNILGRDSSQWGAMWKIREASGHPMIPTHLSPDAVDFLKQCFKRNPNERPNVMHLLNHKFIKGEVYLCQLAPRLSGDKNSLPGLPTQEMPRSCLDKEEEKVSSRLPHRHKRSESSTHKVSSPINMKVRQSLSKDRRVSSIEVYGRPSNAGFGSLGNLQSTEQNEGGKSLIKLLKVANFKAGRQKYSEGDEVNPPKQRREREGTVASSAKELTEENKIMPLDIPRSPLRPVSFMYPGFDPSGKILSPKINKELKVKKAASESQNYLLSNNNNHLPSISSRTFESQEKSNLLSGLKLKQPAGSETSINIIDSVRLKPLDVDVTSKEASTLINEDNSSTNLLKMKNQLLNITGYNGAIKPTGLRHIEEPRTTFTTSTLGDIPRMTELITPRAPDAAGSRITSENVSSRIPDSISHRLLEAVSPRASDATTPRIFNAGTPRNLKMKKSQLGREAAANVFDFKEVDTIKEEPSEKKKRVSIKNLKLNINDSNAPVRAIVIPERPTLEQKASAREYKTPRSKDEDIDMPTSKRTPISVRAMNRSDIISLSGIFQNDLVSTARYRRRDSQLGTPELKQTIKIKSEGIKVLFSPVSRPVSSQKAPPKNFFFDEAPPSDNDNKEQQQQPKKSDPSTSVPDSKETQKENEPNGRPAKNTLIPIMPQHSGKQIIISIVSDSHLQENEASHHTLPHNESPTDRRMKSQVLSVNRFNEDKDTASKLSVKVLSESFDTQKKDKSDMTNGRDEIEKDIVKQSMNILSNKRDAASQDDILAVSDRLMINT